MSNGFSYSMKNSDMTFDQEINDDINIISNSVFVALKNIVNDPTCNYLTII